MYKRRKPEPERDDHVAGNCRICGKAHYYRCAVPGCTDTGSITDSTNHACAGTTRWVCRKHYRAPA